MTTTETTTTEAQAEVLRRVAAEYERVRAAVRAVAYRDADDLLAAAIDRATEKADQFDGENVVAWVAMIARRIQIDAARRRDAEKRATERVKARAVKAAPGADEAALAGLTDPAVTAALADLPAGWREVLVAVAVDGCSYAEAAERCGVPVGTVMSRLNRAKARLRERLA